MPLKKVGSNKKGIKKVLSMYSKESLMNMAETYSDLSVKIKELEAEKKKLADELKKGAESIGVKDDKGSFYFEGDNFIVGKVARKSVKVDNEKAVALLKEKGLKKCFTEKKVVQYTLNEAQIQEEVDNGKLTIDDVKSFTNINTSYSVSVTKKESMPEVQQSVAKRK